MPKHYTSNASLAWFCEFNAELLRYHIHCLEVIEKVCHMPGFADEHSGYISRLASFQSICEAYWKRRAYWINQGLPQGMYACLINLNKFPLPPDNLGKSCVSFSSESHAVCPEYSGRSHQSSQRHPPEFKYGTVTNVG